MVRGPSGGGKTTFLNMIGTIDMPSSGEISNFKNRPNYSFYLKKKKNS
jgi:ABC-type lipoprotein export system ATPase subunit